MSDDELARQLKRQWGLDGRTLITVPLHSLVRLVTLAQQSVTLCQTVGLLASGDGGRNVLRAADRTERQLNYELGVLFG